MGTFRMLDLSTDQTDRVKALVAFASKEENWYTPYEGK